MTRLLELPYGAIGEARRPPEDARASAVEAPHRARDLIRRADWLRERFPDARLPDIERLVKLASRDLLASISARLKDLDRFWEKEQTKADVKVFILDEVYASLPTPPFSPEEKEAVAAEVYTHVWQQAVRGELAMAA